MKKRILSLYFIVWNSSLRWIFLFLLTITTTYFIWKKFIFVKYEIKWLSRSDIAHDFNTVKFHILEYILRYRKNPHTHTLSYYYDDLTKINRIQRISSKLKEKINIRHFLLVRTTTARAITKTKMKAKEKQILWHSIKKLIVRERKMTKLKWM